MSVTATMKLWIYVEGWVSQGDLPAVWMGHPQELEVIERVPFTDTPIKDDKVTLTDGRWGRVSERDHRPEGMVVSVEMHDELSKQGLTDAPGAVQAEEAKSR